MTDALLREFTIQASTVETISGGMVLAGAFDTMKDAGLSARVRDRRAHNRDNAVRLALSVTVASASDTLDVEVYASIGGLETHITDFAQVTVVSVKSLLIKACPALIYVKWIIGGTSPSFTFSVTGSRVVLQ